MLGRMDIFQLEKSVAWGGGGRRQMSGILQGVEALRLRGSTALGLSSSAQQL